MDEISQALLKDVLPVVVTALVSVLVGIMPLLTRAALRWFEAKTKATLDDADRTMIQSALANAAYSALGKKGMAAASGTLADDAIDYLKTSIPGRIAEKGLTDADLTTLVGPHIQKARIEAMKGLAKKDDTRPGTAA